MTTQNTNQYTGRAIITYGRSLMALVIAHSLAKRGIDVISCDSVGMTATSFSKYTSDNFIHADPEDDLEAYIADMRSSIIAHKPDDGRPYILIPAFRDAKLIAKHIDQFSDLITVATTDYDIMHKVDPKDNLMRTLVDLDIKAPKTWQPESVDAIKEIADKCRLPALIKAVDEVGGRGIDFISDKDELVELASKRLPEENPSPLIQEAISGEDYCVCVLCRDGDVVAHMAYKNLQNMPVAGGAGAMRQTVDDDIFLNPVRTLMKNLNWTGIAEIDFRWTGEMDDDPYLIEVNPRFWAGIYQSVESGIDFPWLLFSLFAYCKLPDIEEADTDTRTRVPGLWVAGAIKDAFDQEKDADSMQTTWEKMKDEMKSGAFGMAFSSFGDWLNHATNFDEAIDHLRRQSSHAKSAKSELPFADDPMSAFGVFFVLSSLMRHGKLPDEITR